MSWIRGFLCSFFILKVFFLVHYSFFPLYDVYDQYIRKYANAIWNDKLIRPLQKLPTHQQQLSLFKSRETIGDILHTTRQLNFLSTQ